MTRQRAWLDDPVPLGVVIAVLVVLVLVISCGDSPPPPVADPPSRPPGPTSPARAPPQGVLIVKIDNVAAARPQTGLAGADVVYVEPVEGDVTRLAAVYTSKLPEVIGPVRSARETDVGLFSQYDRPTLAYSGVASALNSLLASAPLIRATPRQVPGAYFRSARRAAPHNLYLRPARLPARAPVNEPLERFGPAPAGGVPTTQHKIVYRRARYNFTWSPGAGGWLVSLDGTPVTSTESGPVSAASVVVQRVPIRIGRVRRDAAGYRSPVAVTVGGGPAEVLRDGQRYSGRWSRPTDSASTEFTTTGGEPLPLAAGRVWILLVPG